jgi:hypothetical protein
MQEFGWKGLTAESKKNFSHKDKVAKVKNNIL